MSAAIQQRKKGERQITASPLCAKGIVLLFHACRDGTVLDTLGDLDHAVLDILRDLVLGVMVWR